MIAAQELVELYQDDQNVKDTKATGTVNILKKTQEKFSRFFNSYRKPKNDVLDLLDLYTDQESFFREGFNRFLRIQNKLPTCSKTSSVPTIELPQKDISSKILSQTSRSSTDGYDASIDDDNISVDTDYLGKSTLEPHFMSDESKRKDKTIGSNTISKYIDRLSTVTGKLRGSVRTGKDVEKLDDVIIEPTEVIILRHDQLFGENPYFSRPLNTKPCPYI
jgi:hypothetical protein